jgi:RNA polymerase sigma factor (sigma-70 family)
MSATATKLAPLKATSPWTDERLVRECVGGSEEAWSALIDKYKNLIYSIPIKQELSREAASDIFQSVCLDLLSELPRLREPRALPKWLIQITLHKCARWTQREGRYSQEEISDALLPAGPASAELIAEEVRQEQTLRESLAALPDRCAEMVRMLFFETPARPYGEVARELGLATGSIGFIRGRCLDRLKKELQRRGFK